MAHSGPSPGVITANAQGAFSTTYQDSDSDYSDSDDEYYEQAPQEIYQDDENNERRGMRRDTDDYRRGRSVNNSRERRSMDEQRNDRRGMGRHAGCYMRGGEGHQKNGRGNYKEKEEQIRLPPLSKRIYATDVPKRRGGMQYEDEKALREPEVRTSHKDTRASPIRTEQQATVALIPRTASRRRRQYAPTVTTRDWSEDYINELQGYLNGGAKFHEPTNRRPFLSIVPKGGDTEYALENSQLLRVQADKQVCFEAPRSSTVGEVRALAEHTIFNDQALGAGQFSNKRPLVESQTTYHITGTRAIPIHSELTIGRFHDKELILHAEHAGAEFGLFNTLEEVEARKGGKHFSDFAANYPGDETMSVAVRYPHHHGVIVHNDSTTKEIYERVGTELVAANHIDVVNSGDRISLHLVRGGGRAGDPIEASDVIGYLDPSSTNKFPEDRKSMIDAASPNKKYNRYVLTWVRDGSA